MRGELMCWLPVGFVAAVAGLDHRRQGLPEPAYRTHVQVLRGFVCAIGVLAEIHPVGPDYGAGQHMWVMMRALEQLGDFNGCGSQRVAGCFGLGAIKRAATGGHFS